MDKSQDVIVNFLKTYGFVYPDSEIYGGLANAWDYGPLGVLLKNNIKSLWWREFVTKLPNSYGLDSAIINNPKTYVASGHLANFSDPLIDCKACKMRFRADKLLEEKGVSASESLPSDKLYELIVENQIVCPNCGKMEWTPIRKFNLMFKTFIGVTEDTTSTVYLRPETCQPIFTNFNNIVRTTRAKLPFAVCQIGKSFRNEITPSNFIFRTREFEQMEIEYFTYPERSMDDFNIWIERIKKFLFETLGFRHHYVCFHEIPDGERAFYSQRTIDIEYKYPFGQKELWGCAHRGNYDLTQHSTHSNKDLCYVEADGTKVIPHVIEPSVGCDRLMYAIICEKYDIEKLEDGDEREVLHLPVSLAPYKVAILPLVNKLKEKAETIYHKLLDKNISCTFDTSGSIGKRYRRQDAIGTPYCITIDFDTLEKNTITIRERDSMKQETINLDTINEFINSKINI